MGSYMERSWDRDGGGDGPKERDGNRSGDREGGGRGKQVFPSRRGSGFQHPGVDPSIPHPSNSMGRRSLS